MFLFSKKLYPKVMLLEIPSFLKAKQNNESEKTK